MICKSCEGSGECVVWEEIDKETSYVCNICNGTGRVPGEE